MPKEFYTEKDIEDMCRRGILSLEVHDQVVLTELAYERARSLGMKLLREKPDNPPSAPVRPYIAKMQTPPPPAMPAGQPLPCCRAAADAPVTGLQEHIKSAVVARLGTQVDQNLLDVIIRRVLTSTGVK